MEPLLLPVCSRLGRVAGHAVERAVELQIGDAVVALLASGLLHAGGNVFRHLPEDGDNPLDGLLICARLHVTRDVLNEALLGTVIENLLPQLTRCVEVLRPDLRQEGDGITLEIVVNLIQFNRPLLKLDGLN